ncbi:polyhydroxyalkanoic acid system family protein [Altererythrobacter sp. Z27]|uniref:polyhydroxyalkanoic acid system family protein n=1 Tax=Altererythrobacter sp. Z27 TaxID=3461147 RepID=UPI004044740D
MRVALPHDLGREEVRRRLSERSHEIADHMPGGLAQVETDWIGEDSMALHISAMGQNLTGHIHVEDRQVVFEIKLPGMLSFVEPMIEKAIRKDGARLLEAPK